jgi:uncharacterized OB-fold protein
MNTTPAPASEPRPAAQGSARAASAGGVPDWTRGGRGVALQRCAGCGHVWYFRRTFCPACGRDAPEDLSSAGRGEVYAVTVVHRAPDDAFRAIAPYCLVLVALDEGPRVMAHAPAGVAIGDRVTLGWREAAGRLLPYFQPDGPREGPDR